MSGWLTGKYNWKCEPVDYSNNTETLRVSILTLISRLIY